jgi:hypothetical protein
MQKSRPLEIGQCEDSSRAMQTAKLFYIRRLYWSVQAAHNTLEANRVYIHTYILLIRSYLIVAINNYAALIYHQTRGTIIWNLERVP